MGKPAKTQDAPFSYKRHEGRDTVLFSMSILGVTGFMNWIYDKERSAKLKRRKEIKRERKRAEYALKKAEQLKAKINRFEAKEKVEDQVWEYLGIKR